MRKKKTEIISDTGNNIDSSTDSTVTESKIEKIASTDKYEAYKLTLTMKDFQNIISERIQNLPSKELVYDTDITVGDFKLLLTPFDGTVSSMLQAEKVSSVIEHSLRIAEEVQEQVEVLKAKDEKRGHTIH